MPDAQIAGHLRDPNGALGGEDPWVKIAPHVVEAIDTMQPYSGWAKGPCGV